MVNLTRAIDCISALIHMYLKTSMIPLQLATTVGLQSYTVNDLWQYHGVKNATIGHQTICGKHMTHSVWLVSLYEYSLLARVHVCVCVCLSVCLVCLSICVCVHVQHGTIYLKIDVCRNN